MFHLCSQRHRFFCLSTPNITPLCLLSGETITISLIDFSFAEPGKLLSPPRRGVAYLRRLLIFALSLLTLPMIMPPLHRNAAYSPVGSMIIGNVRRDKAKIN